MIREYRKRPVLIKAVEWTGDNFEEIERFVGESALYNAGPQSTYYDAGPYHSNLPLRIGELYIDTLEGLHHASVGDYIIQGVNGEFYPCKPDIFHKTYELADWNM